ncbi:MAG: hypothetical protein AB7O88_00835 [Reyranellaceae bacterium]
MRVWLIATLFAALVAAAPALALDPPAPSGDMSAPATHKPTGLTFPPSIAGVSLRRSIDYGRSAGNPGLGYGYTYALPGRLVITAYVYDLGRRVPVGHQSPLLTAAFDESLQSIHLVAQRSGKYRDLRVVQAPSACPYGAVVFRCATLSATSADGTLPLYTKLLLTGYRDHFLKLRVDWRQDSPGDTAEVERVVQTFVGAILR